MGIGGNILCIRKKKAGEQFHFVFTVSVFCFVFKNGVTFEVAQTFFILNRQEHCSKNELQALNIQNALQGLICIEWQIFVCCLLFVVRLPIVCRKAVILWPSER